MIQLKVVATVALLLIVTILSEKAHTFPIGHTAFSDNWRRQQPLETAYLPSSKESMTFARYGSPLPSSNPNQIQKPPYIILYLHGLTSSRIEADLFDQIANTLNITLIAIDRPGYGKSRIEAKGDLHGLTAKIHEFLDTLDICPKGAQACGLIGFSAGGIQAAALGIDPEQRFNRLSLVSSVSQRDEGSLTWPNSIAEFADMITSFSGIKTACQTLPIRKIETIWAPGAFLAPKILFPAFYRNKEDAKLLNESYFASWLYGIMREGMQSQPCGVIFDVELTKALSFDENQGINLEEINLKTFIFHGERDWLVPRSHALNFYDSIPDAEIAIIPGEGHLSVLGKYRQLILETMVNGSLPFP